MNISGDYSYWWCQKLLKSNFEWMKQSIEHECWVINDLSAVIMRERESEIEHINIYIYFTDRLTQIICKPYKQSNQLRLI